MSQTTRLDLELVRRGLARSRGHARSLIDAGDVTVAGVLAGKPSAPVAETDVVDVREGGPQWVSRAAYKLVGAFEAFGPTPDGPPGSRSLVATGKACLDVGGSRGASPLVRLPRGAPPGGAPAGAPALLGPAVAADPRVENRPGTTIRGLTPQDIGGPVDLLVADLSFISLTLVLPTFRGLLRDDGDAVVLVKPQFEVGRTRLGKGGIVRAQGDRAWAITEVARAAIEAGLHPKGLVASPIQGGEGNAEYLLWLTPRAGDGVGWEALVRTADEVSAP